MNCAPPEIEAIRYLWPKLVGGGIVLLDDYAYVGYHHQKKAMDEFANSVGVEIVSLPTGQGLLIKNWKERYSEIAIIVMMLHNTLLVL